MELSWIYVIPAVVMTLALFVVCRRTGTLVHPAPVLFGLYWASSVGALIINVDTLPGFNFVHTWQMMAGYSAMVLAVLFPAYFIPRIKPPRLSESGLFRLILMVLIPLAWASFIYQIPFAFASLQAGADTIRMRLSTEEFAPLPQNLLTTIATATTQFYPLYALAAVEGYVRRRGFLYIASCVVGVLCVVVNSLCFSARDGVLWFLMSFWFAYWIYRPELKDRFGRAVLAISALAVAGVLLVLAVFTYQRFGSSRVGIFDSVVTYFGQQPYVFAETVAEQSEFYGLNLRLPLIAEWMGTFESVRRENVYEWTFGTFAKDFYAMDGWLTAFIAAGAIGLVFFLIFKAHRRVNEFGFCMLLLLYFQFTTQGMFFFRLGIRAGNYYILIILALAFLAQIISPRATGDAPGEVGRVPASP